MAPKPFYTGEILEEVLTQESEYTTATEEISFSAEQNAIWADLYKGIQQPQFLEHICQEYQAGLDRLDLDPAKIPSIADLNRNITPHTGWKVTRTAVRYTKADTWYQKFAQREFLVTDYLRTREQLQFTPEPDMFHDIVGHLPFLTLPFYAEIEDLFAPAYFNATPEEREIIKRLAWYSTEFGLVVQDNRIRVFGAGIISGRMELAGAIMESYRLDKFSLLDYTKPLFPQLQQYAHTHRDLITEFMQAISALHAAGEMSSAENGWSVVRNVQKQLGIASTEFYGGEVLLLPFDLDLIAQVPKTVYALNPIFFVAESLPQMKAELDRFLLPLQHANA